MQKLIGKTQKKAHCFMTIITNEIVVTIMLHQQCTTQTYNERGTKWDSLLTNNLFMYKLFIWW